MIKVNGIEVKHKGEKNLLELVRSAGIELPTFCYQPELSVFGSCRMCIVEVEGRGVVPACSTAVWDGMDIKTNTKLLRNSRKMIVELMLAAHDQDCKTCAKSSFCKLQDIAKDLGVDEVRFKKSELEHTLDKSGEIIRDTGKCILCGNCVRQCSEKQAVGALDFAFRGSNAKVLTEYNRDMDKTQCVNCGQCVKVCPVGALTGKPQIEEVWSAIGSGKTVVAQIAPAVRVALGEYFGIKGRNVIGKIITALRKMGFAKIYDTAFAADLTVLEEGAELVERLTTKKNLPVLTSCCPSWVKWVEQFRPDLIPNLSSARSPQQMFGAVIKDKMKDAVVVSIMPCISKKEEAKREEFGADVDFVITTGELAQMIKQSGLDFAKLKDGQFDEGLGEATGAGIIFGASGGVSEAVVRHLGEKAKGARVKAVSGLQEAKQLLEEKDKYDIIEVMACQGGCVNGGGQPVGCATTRRKSLRKIDDKKRSSENVELAKLSLDKKKAHDILHTTYSDKKRTNKK